MKFSLLINYKWQKTSKIAGLEAERKKGWNYQELELNDKKHVGWYFSNISTVFSGLIMPYTHVQLAVVDSEAI